jgi:hypothetical protein
MVPTVNSSEAERLHDEVESFHNDLEAPFGWNVLKSGAIEAEWVLGGATHRVTLQRNARSGEWGAVLEDGSKMSYRSLLASPMLGGLRQLARNHATRLGQARRQQFRRLNEVGEDHLETRLSEVFIPNDIGITADELEGSAGGHRAPAIRVLDEVADQATDPRATKVFFLLSPAGQGKSRSLIEFCLGRATRFASARDTIVGPNERLAFYVDAQGRGLGQLQEVLAFELNRLHILLPYGSFIPLVRNGLVVLVIDGFDELIGQTGSFNDAYNSLKEFLRDIDGGGILVGAARSSYFAQDFIARERTLQASRSDDDEVDAAYELSVGQLHPWSMAQRKQFANDVLPKMRLTEPERKRVSKSFSQLIDADTRDFLGRPLFCLSVLRLLKENSAWVERVGQNMDHVTAEIASAYIHREVTTKISPNVRQWVSDRVLRRYYAEIAQEMWQLETRAIPAGDRVDSLSTSQVLMEALCEEEAMPVAARKELRQRANYLPMISFDERAKTIRFDHELFFAHFVADPIIAAVNGPHPTQSLVKNALDDDVAAAIASRLGSSPISQTINKFCSVARNAPALGSARVKTNCGHIIAAALNQDFLRGREPIVGLKISDVDFTGTSLLAGVKMEDLTLNNVSFWQVDLQGSILKGNAMGSTVFGAVKIDPESRIVLGGLQEKDVHAIDVSFDYRRIIDRLLGRDVSDSWEAADDWMPKDALRIVQAACRKLDMVVLLRDTDEHPSCKFLKSRHWPVIVDAFVASKLLREEVGHASSGPKMRVWRRRCDGSKVMAGYLGSSTDDRIVKFWSLLKGSFG